MSELRPAAARRNRRLAGAGVAGLAAVVAVAPHAAAQVTSAHPSTGTAHPGGTDAARTAAKPARGTQSGTPNYGFTKFRVGVQIKTGAYVPQGTTTAGSQLTLVETGPFADSVNNGPWTGTCTTQVTTLAPTTNGTETYCPSFQTVTRAAIARARALGYRGALGPSAPGQYTAGPGDTVTITQTGAQPGLVADPTGATVGPTTCEGTGICTNDVDPALLVDGGLPPVASNDSATVEGGHSVAVRVLANDDTKGAPSSIAVAAGPSHGSVEVSGAAGYRPQVRVAAPQQIRYTPKAGFVGHDSFTYTLTTANGSSTARVDVTVTAPPPTAVDDSATTTSGSSVRIVVLGNDSANGGGRITIASTGRPAHGTVRLVGRQAVYTPDAGFVGTDHFTYVISTRGGTATATVTIDVKGAPAPSPSSSDQPLAVTGTPTGLLAELGVGLVALGGVATAVGRRRRRGKHA